MPHKHFPNLDVLRFYAAMCVVLWHTNYRLDQPWTTIGFISGYDAVTLFFVLSGFLITYLLLVEKRATARPSAVAGYVEWEAAQPAAPSSVTGYIEYAPDVAGATTILAYLEWEGQFPDEGGGPPPTPPPLITSIYVFIV